MWGTSTVRCLIGPVRALKLVRLRLGSKPLSQRRPVPPRFSQTPVPNPGVGVQDESDVHDEPFGSWSGRFTAVRAAQSAKLRDEVDIVGDRDDVQKPEEDVRESQRVRGRRRNTPYWFFLQCKRLVKEGKLSDALDMFEKRMLKEERVQPEEFNYTVIIGGCGRCGYVKKAFILYNDMKKRALVPTDATYTALFNACAESPWPTDGFARAEKLRQELVRCEYKINQATWHALIKAYAHCANLEHTLDAIQCMQDEGHWPTNTTFALLLRACSKDGKTGFRCALQVWQEMIQLGLERSAQCYSLLLIAARDCELGDPKVATRLLLEAGKPVLSMECGDTQSPLLLVSDRQDRSGQKVSHAHVKLNVVSLKQRLLINSDLGAMGGNKLKRRKVDHEGKALLTSGLGTTPCKPTSGAITPPMVRCKPDDRSWTEQVLNVQERVPASATLTTYERKKAELLPPSTFHPEDALVDRRMVAMMPSPLRWQRLAILGGPKAFLGCMKDDAITPDVRTSTLLLEILEPTVEAELNLLQQLAIFNLRLDLGFYNILLRRRARRGDLHAAKEVIGLISEQGLIPDMATYCCLAVGCKKEADGIRLLNDMRMSGMEPNQKVLGALVSNAVRRLDYAYLISLLHDMEKAHLPVNEVILHQLEFASRYPPGMDKYVSPNIYLEKIDGFRGYFQDWKHRVCGVDTPHPWAQFRNPKKPKKEEREEREKWENMV
uniref:pentatricopeptide repeat-containing protein 1, mitochondrial n=1 Tax=Myxine glutinosa TaxID=7769 RepID=UPI00358DE653